MSEQDAVERWRAMGEKAKGEHDRMAGFPGSGYVSRLGKEMVKMADALKASQQENERLWEALLKIQKLGGTCNEYEICTHKACAESYAAWAIANAALEEGTQDE